MEFFLPQVDFPFITSGFPLVTRESRDDLTRKENKKKKFFYLGYTHSGTMRKNIFLIFIIFQVICNRLSKKKIPLTTIGIFPAHRFYFQCRINFQRKNCR